MKVTIKSYQLLRVVLFAILAWYFVTSCYKKFNHDEFEAVHTAWKMLHGERIYIDFFQHHHPLVYWLLMPFIAVFGENIHAVLWLSVLFFILMLATLYLLYLLAQLVFSDKLLATAVVVICASFVHYQNYSWEIRPDTLQSFFAVCCWYLLLRWKKEGNISWLLLSAVCLALSFLALQKAIFMAFGIGLVQLLWLRKGHIRFQQFLWFWLCFLCMLLPFFIYLLAAGHFSNYYFLNWTVNAHFAKHFTPFDNLHNSAIDNFLSWGLFAIGLIFARREMVTETALIAIVVFLGYYVVRAPNPQYLLQFAPLMSIVAVAGLQKIVRDETAKLVVVCLATIMPLYIISRQWLSWKRTAIRAQQVERLAFVLAHTRPTDRVLDGQIESNVFRKDADFFWFSVPYGLGLTTYQSLRPYHYNAADIIALQQPVIVNKNCLAAADSAAISLHYKPSAQYPDLLLRNR